MNPRHKVFSLEEANSLLPQLETLLMEMENKYERFRKLEDELFFLELLEGISPPEPQLQELEMALLTLEEEIERIRGLGCILRHAERGLVDFLGRQNEKWIYYCWRRGEKEIQYYHTPCGGFLERHPFAEDKPSI